MALYDSDSDEDARPPPAKVSTAPSSAPAPVNSAPEPTKEQPPPRNDGAKDVSMKFLAAQLQQKRTFSQTSGFKPVISPVVDLSSRNKAPAINMRRVAPVRARPVIETATFSFLPKAATDDSFMMFGEVIVKNEYQPAVPNDYVQQKKKKEERELKEKAAKEVAERLEKEHKEEALKREKGAAIAPPTALLEPSPIEEKPLSEGFKPPATIPSFGKATTKGLGIAASIMSKYGYKEGAGLGREGQGISKALSVERLGRNTGVITNEGAPQPAAAPAFTMPSRPANQAAVMSTASKVLLMTNMVGADEVDSELENDVREEMTKCGQVHKIVVHKVENPPDDENAVRVFVEFTNAAQAIKAYVVMNGRFFGGRQVSAKFYDFDEFCGGSYEK